MDKDCNGDYNDGKDNDEDLLDQIRRIYYADVIKGGELSALDVKRTYMRCFLNEMNMYFL